MSDVMQNKERWPDVGFEQFIHDPLEGHWQEENIQRYGPPHKRVRVFSLYPLPPRACRKKAFERPTAKQLVDAANYVQGEVDKARKLDEDLQQVLAAIHVRNSD